MTSPAHSPDPSHPIELHSDALPDLFEKVGQQVLSRFVNPDDVGAALREKIALEAENPEALLVQWVTTLLEFLTTQRMVFNQFKIDLKVDQNQHAVLKAEAVGELLDVQRHSLRKDPALFRCGKAHLRQNGQTYHAEILLTQAF